MTRRLSLPTTSEPARSPTVDAVRKRLGGRASTEAGAGQVLAFRDERGGQRLGVVLFARGPALDVWVEGDVVRRVQRSETAPLDGVVPPELFAVARDVEAFAALREGQRVRYQHPGGLGEGALLEKCRFGALVERDDRTVLGIGFRRLSGLEAG